MCTHWDVSSNLLIWTQSQFDDNTNQKFFEVSEYVLRNLLIWIGWSYIKGALDNFSLMARFFFFKVEFFIPFEVYTHVVTTCLKSYLQLRHNFYTKIYGFFL